MSDQGPMEGACADPGGAVAEVGDSQQAYFLAPEFMAAVVASSQDAIFTTDLDGAITSWNPGAERLYGYRIAEVLGEHVSVLAGYRNADEVESHLERIRTGEVIERTEVERRHKDGRILFVSLAISPVELDDGTLVGASMVVRDVSQQREWDERLAQMTRRIEQQTTMLDVVLRTTPDLLFLFDRTGRFMYVSEPALAALDARLEDMFGRRGSGLKTRSQLLDVIDAHVLDVMGTASEWRGEAAVPDGARSAACEVLIAPVVGPEGDVSGAVATVRDISARSAAEAQAAAEKSFTDAVIDAAPGIFFTTDRDGRLVRWNAQAERFTGLGANELIGADGFAFVLDEDREAARAGLQAAIETGSSQVQVRWHGVDGVRDNLVISRRADIGGSPYIIGFAMDVTERVRAEAEVREARDGLEERVEERTKELQAANARLKRTERALLTLSWSNQALAQATDPERLLQDVCAAAVELGGYRMAWVGLVVHDGSWRIAPVARAGLDEGFLDTVEITWGDEASGVCAAGRSVREGHAVIVGDLAADGAGSVWRDAAAMRGYRSALSLPLTDPRGETWGVFCLFSGEQGAFDDREVALLEELSMDLSFGMESLSVRATRDDAEGRLRDSYDRLEHMMHDTVSAMGRIVEARDPYTQGHERRVAELSRSLSDEMGLGEDFAASVEMAALLHDIGKLCVPAEILTKPVTLSASEFDMIKDHARQGYEILKDIAFPWPIADIVLQHHERMDGSGYPSGISGEQILLQARILAVADVVEAMASHRPYRPVIGLTQAMQVISEGAGKFDPDVVAACERLYANGGIRL